MTDSQAAEREAEIAFLHRRIAELDAELLEQARRTNATVAAAQQRAYWLDRWHVDLNALMDRPAADRLRAAARAVRAPVRRARLLLRNFRG